MMFRRANRCDEKAVYDLSNDPEIRKYSFNTKPILFNEHKDWFEKQLNDNEIIYFVAYDNDNLVGQIRFKIMINEAIVSVSVSSSYRGKGHGVEMMHHALSFFKQSTMVFIVKAFIRADNFGSKQYFEKCGFRFVEHTIYSGIATDIYEINVFDKR